MKLVKQINVPGNLTTKGGEWLTTTALDGKDPTTRRSGLDELGLRLLRVEEDGRRQHPTLHHEKATMMVVMLNQYFKRH